MGGKSKHFLKEEAVPAIFSFAPEPARKGRESLISRAKKRAKKLCIEEAFCSHEACSSHVYKEDIQELELTSEKSIGTEPLITVDKAQGKYTTTKSVCTQYNPLNVLNKLETTETCKHDLKVKWPTSKRREKAVNITDFSQIQKCNLFLPKTLQLFQMNSLILNQMLPLTVKVTNLTVLRRQVKVISHLTQANN